MNKTIQSNSYRGYSKSLLDSWISDFGNKPESDKNFLEKNLHNCLKEFKTWALSQGAKANELALQQKDFKNLTGKRKENFQVWLDEKISKMLDVYWAPLSQAATQYTSPTYKAHLDDLIKSQNLIGKIDAYLAEINKLVGSSGADTMTINDILLFFDELTLIRRHPYTKMAYISIPFRVFESKSSSINEKLAGIAHELGHFVYWRLATFDQINEKQKKDQDEIVKSLKNKPYNHPEDKEIRFVKFWIEEMFADFVGAKIAGDAYVKSSKEMIVRGNKSSLSLGDNDQEHVPDILRPLVSIYTLNRDRTKAIEEWKLFFENDYPVDISTIKIKAFSEKDGQRDIYRSPEQLTKILLDTIDILSNKIIGKDGQSLLQPNFAAISNPSSILAKKASIIAQQSDSKLTDLDIFLEPIALEAGAEDHFHTYKQGHHKRDSYTFSHTH
ncbi:MAG: hypothetical protein L0287_13755 [Anaerolineae bacterium]|nr:hypothetical protein [Anaerolineae bacterium]MCI0608613.1 hypothetical protein [Anaerolineae bacterium]